MVFGAGFTGIDTPGKDTLAMEVLPVVPACVASHVALMAPIVPPSPPRAIPTFARSAWACTTPVSSFRVASLVTTPAVTSPATLRFASWTDVGPPEFDGASGPTFTGGEPIAFA